MSIKKICVFIGSRANYASIKSVLEEIKKNNFKLQLIVGGSAILDRYGSLDSIISKDGFKIDYRINFLIEGDDITKMPKSTGLAIIETSTALKKMQPDLVVVIGDRFEMLSIAISASYMNIPLAHTMGGEVSGTIDESIRHAITKLSHLHFVSNNDSYNRVKKLGENKYHIYNVGCPRIDEIKKVLINKKKLSFDINSQGVGDKINLQDKFILVSQHPVTTEFNLEEKNIMNTLLALEEFDIAKIILWPNADLGSEQLSKGIRKLREKKKISKARIFKNFEFKDYIYLLDKTLCLVGNSSSGLRDCAFIGTPVVNIGNRQKNRMQSYNVINCDNTKNAIVHSIAKQIRHGKYKRRYIYGNGEAGKKIIKIIKKIKKISVQKEISY